MLESANKNFKEMELKEQTEMLQKVLMQTRLELSSANNKISTLELEIARLKHYFETNLEVIIQNYLNQHLVFLDEEEMDDMDIPEDLEEDFNDETNI